MRDLRDNLRRIRKQNWFKELNFRNRVAWYWFYIIYVNRHQITQGLILLMTGASIGIILTLISR